jgi:integrase
MPASKTRPTHFHPKLQIFEPQKDAASIQPPPTVSTLTAEQLGQLADQIAERLRVPDGERGIKDTRTVSPGVNSPGVKLLDLPAGGGVVRPAPSAPVVTSWPLRACLESDVMRNGPCRSGSSWGLYRTLVRHWEAAWNGPGPDCRSLTGEQIHEGFLRVDAWTSQRSWQKNRDYLFCLLKSCCRQSLGNKRGIPADQAAPLEALNLPIWDVPPKAWFRSRPKSTTRHAGHRPSSLPLLTVEELDRVMLAAGGTDDPLYWRVLIAWLWFCGMRIRDAIAALTWRDSIDDDGVDLANRLLHFTESKCGGALDVPIPEYLCIGLAALKERQPRSIEGPGRSPRFVFWRSSNWKNLSRWFYPTWKLIWQRAGVPCRMPHQMRGVCISWWLVEAEKYRKLVTGHSLGNDVQMQRYATFGDDFRRAAENHPRSSVPLP